MLPVFFCLTKAYKHATLFKEPRNEDMMSEGSIYAVISQREIAMQMTQLVAPTQQSANNAVPHLPRKERREQAGLGQKWLHKKMVADVSATITPSEVPQKKGLIKLRVGHEFVLIFECLRKDVPKGIQILPLTGVKAKTSKQSNSESDNIRLSTVKVDIDSLMERVSVNSVNVTDRAGYIVVYLNCTVEKTKGSGFNHWGGGTYEAFVKRTLSQTWNRAITKNESASRTSLTLRKSISEQYETKIRFAIE